VTTAPHIPPRPPATKCVHDFGLEPELELDELLDDDGVGLLELAIADEDESSGATTLDIRDEPESKNKRRGKESKNWG
jgi:hypothetical protein